MKLESEAFKKDFKCKLRDCGYEKYLFRGVFEETDSYEYLFVELVPELLGF